MDRDAVRRLARREIVELAPYRSARSIVSESDDLVFLDANESPRPVSAGAPEDGRLNRYPEPQPARLRRAIAELYDADEDSLLMSRGVDEAIDLLLRVFCRAGVDRILVCPPTYGFYAISARIQGAGIVEAPFIRRGAEFVLDVDRIAEAADETLKVAFLCSPNNPTGHAIDTADVLRVCDALADRALVALDEAYVEFSSQTSLLPLVRERPNLVVFRTLSKAWGLAAARFGITFAGPPVIELLKKVCPPYPLSLPAVRLVEKALSTRGRDRVRDAVRETLAERSWLATELARLPAIREVFPSDANFLLIRVADVPAFMERCGAAGVVVRDRSTQHGLEGCVRISVGARDEHRRLLAALASTEA